DPERTFADLQLGEQALRAEVRCAVGRVDPGGDPVVDQAAAEVMGVDPVRHRGIVVVRDEQGQAEAAQYPLRRALPLQGVVAYLDELTGEGQRRLGQPKLPAQPLPQLQTSPGNVAASRL